jgi:hypothetical protein
MGVSGQRHAKAALLPPGKIPPVPTVEEAGWASEPVWTQRLEEKSLAFSRDRTSISGRPVRSQTLYRLNYPAPSYFHCLRRLLHSEVSTLYLSKASASVPEHMIHTRILPQSNTTHWYTAPDRGVEHDRIRRLLAVNNRVP